MDNMKHTKSYEYASTATYDDGCPPVGYPTGSHGTRGRDPFYNFLEGFSEIYLQGKEVMEKLFPGACDELLDFFTKITLRERVPRKCSRTMQRSLSMGSVCRNERFKVKSLDVGEIIKPDKDDKAGTGSAMTS